MTEEMNADANTPSEKIEDVIDGVVEEIDDAVTSNATNDVVYDHAAMTATDDDKLWSLLAFVFPPLVSIILFFMEDKKNRPFIKANSIQALILGVVIAALTASALLSCLALPVWLYSVYLGFKAYNGDIAEIPGITNFAKNQGWI